MNPVELNGLKDLFVDLMFSDKIIPGKIIDRLGAVFSDPQYAGEIMSAWIRKNEERTVQFELNTPLFLTRGFDKNHNDEMKKYLPEEKLISYGEIFRRKLDAVDFGEINVFEEKKIIDELISEIPGLTLSEVILYYNIFKIDGIMKNKKDIATHGNNNYFPEKFLKKIEENLFLTVDSMYRLNGNKTVHKDIIFRILEEKRSGMKSPEILSFLFDDGNQNLVDKMKSFLENIAEKFGDDPVEIFNYLGLYMILSDADGNLMRHLQLSPHLNEFVNGKPGEIKQSALPVKVIYHQAVIYIFSFIYEIAGFVYKISGKYAVSGSEQKSRLVKLISPERIRHFIENAHDMSLKNILKFHADAKDLLPVLKRFIRTNRDIIKSDDLFYNGGHKKPS